MGRRSRNSDAAMQAAAFTILFALVIGIINLLFFSKSGFAKFVRSIVLTVLLMVGLWNMREWMRPDFYKCEMCGKEYTCEDEAGREPHGYCENAASHKHRGAVIERYDMARGVSNTVEWVRGDVARIRRVFSIESEQSPEGTGPEKQRGIGTSKTSS